MEEQARTLGIPTVPVLFRGAVETEGQLHSMTEMLAQEPSCYGPDREGVVVRVRRSFETDEFGQVVAEFVRAGHVTTSEHWMFQQIRVQSLAEVS